MREGEQKASSHLIEAASSGDLATVKKLIADGASVNSRFRDGFTALMTAAVAGHIPIVSFLIERGANLDLVDNHGVTALMYAASHGQADIVGNLIDGGAEVNLKNTSRNELYSGWTALMHGAQNLKDNREVIKTLLSSGAHVNEQDEYGETALMKAASACNIGVVMELIAAGANVFVINKDGDRALDFAEAIGQVRIAEILRQAEMKGCLKQG